MSGTASSWDRRALFVAGAIALVTLLVHASSLDGDFVYDDHRFIEHNDELWGLSWIDAFTDPATASAGEGIVHDIYRPLRTILYSVQYTLFVNPSEETIHETSTAPWHAVSIVLHVLCTLLVFRVLRGLLPGALWPAAAGAVLFGVHPYTSESVAWLSSQGDLLAMALLLGALVVMERPGLGRTIGGGVLFFLACLAKESAFMLPALLPLRDLALPRDRPEHPSPWARTTWLRVGVLGALALAYLALRHAVLPGLAQVGHAHGSVFATARAMADGMTWYLQGLVLPVGFSFDTRIAVPERWSDPEVWVGLGVLGTLIAAGVYGLRTRRYVLAFACLGVLVALGPVSNVIVPLKTFVADRFFYPALLCAAAGLAALLAHLRGTPRAAVFTLTTGVLATFAFLTVERNGAWADNGTLWRAVRDDRPWNANAYQGLAFEAAHAREVQAAENAYATYLEANPFDAKSMFTMGNLFGEMAEGLAVVGGMAPGEEITTPVRRKQARVAQIRLYQRAFEVWDQPGGLAIGRGSPALVVAMLDKWIEAATDLGDLGSAKFANDRAIEWESPDTPIDVSDPEAVEARASWKRRRIRTALAIRAAKAHSDRKAPRGMREQVVRIRATVLRDALFDPNKSDKALRGDFLDRLAFLEKEALAGDRWVPDEQLYLEQTALTLGMRGGMPTLDDMRRALTILKRGLSVHGDQSVLRGQHDILQRDIRRLERGRGGR